MRQIIGPFMIGMLVSTSAAACTGTVVESTGANAAMTRSALRSIYAMEPLQDQDPVTYANWMAAMKRKRQISYVPIGTILCIKKRDTTPGIVVVDLGGRLAYMAESALRIMR